jgi:hypothetical protein
MTPSRRKILKGIASLPFTLPLLEVTQEAKAQSGQRRKRVILIHSPNGTITEHMIPRTGYYGRGARRLGTQVNLAESQRCQVCEGARTPDLVGQQVRMEELHRDRAFEPLVEGAPHLGGTAARQQLVQPEAIEDPALGHGNRSRSRSMTSVEAPASDGRHS